MEALQYELKDRMADLKNNENTIQTTFSKAESLITNPVKLWKNSDYDIRQLLIMVWFG